MCTVSICWHSDLTHNERYSAGWEITSTAINNTTMTSLADRKVYLLLFLLCSWDLKRSHFRAELHKQALLSAWLKTVSNRDDTSLVTTTEHVTLWKWKVCCKVLRQWKIMGQSLQPFLKVMTYVYFFWRILLVVLLILHFCISLNCLVVKV